MSTSLCFDFPGLCNLLHRLVQSLYYPRDVNTERHAEGSVSQPRQSVNRHVHWPRRSCTCSPAAYMHPDEDPPRMHVNALEPSHAAATPGDGSIEPLELPVWRDRVHRVWRNLIATKACMHATTSLGKDTHITNQSLMQSNPGTAGPFRKVNIWTRITGRKW